eukprot:Plantae.Rhodophyta-Hildenbrandia_rubra.ctg37253.p2 GENE.Plantae.Rhodophyta-Hildenbrandia_rubra.ctg37253~~Plantae.Rhodophyta-Hildenbrandia_rubra.ctg37253.p2  ORF type:complete len:113 (+),score=1.24 Plantae.Rhodophyta-Hildenbrandia_rubra.ctg37253:21-359(+)
MSVVRRTQPTKRRFWIRHPVALSSAGPLGRNLERRLPRPLAEQGDGENRTGTRVYVPAGGHGLDRYTVPVRSVERFCASWISIGEKTGSRRARSMTVHRLAFVMRRLGDAEV